MYYGKVLGYDPKSGQPIIKFQDKSISDERVSLNQFVTLAKHAEKAKGTKISTTDVDAWKNADFSSDLTLWQPMDSIREKVAVGAVKPSGGGGNQTVEAWVDSEEEDTGYAGIRSSMGAVSLEEEGGEDASVADITAGIDGLAPNLGGSKKKTKPAAPKHAKAAKKKAVKKMAVKKVAPKKKAAVKKF